MLKGYCYTLYFLVLKHCIYYCSVIFRFQFLTIFIYSDIFYSTVVLFLVLVTHSYYYVASTCLCNSSSFSLLTSSFHSLSVFLCSFHPPPSVCTVFRVLPVIARYWFKLCLAVLSVSSCSSCHFLFQLYFPIVYCKPLLLF